jgi:hypothetical protein
MQINTCGRRLAFFNGATDASVDVVCAKGWRIKRARLVYWLINIFEAIPPDYYSPRGGC